MKKIIVLLKFLLFALGGFSQMEIRNMDGLLVWYSADSIHRTNEGLVDSLYDKSPNGLHAIQHTMGKQPQLVDNIVELNNQSSLLFSGLEYMEVDFDEIIFQPNTIVLVMRVNDVDKVPQVFYCGLSDAERHQLQLNKNTILMYAGGMLESNYTPINNYSLYESVWNNNKSSLYVNSSLVMNGNAGGLNIRGLTIGAYHGGAFGLRGNISEFLVFNNILTDEDFAKVESYLRGKYIPSVVLNDIIVEYGFKPLHIDVERPWFTKYKWSTGSETANIDINKTGTYIVTITDIWGESNTDSFEVNFVEPFQLRDTTICEGDSIIWDPYLSGLYFYEWSDGSSESTLKISKTGKYWVRITDTLGYTWESDTINVHVEDLNEKHIFSDSNVQLCFGDNLLTFLEGAYSYEWTTKDTTKQIKIYKPGIYGVTVTSDIGCGEIYEEVNVSIKGDLPIPQFVSQYHCLGDTTELISNSYTTDNTQITQTSWVLGNDTLGGTTQQCVFETDGSFPITLVVENEVGCAQSLIDTIDIYPVPDVRFAPKISCQYTANEIVSQSSIKSGTIESYQWFFQDKKSSDSYITFGSDEIGTYPVSLRVTSDKGCINESTDTVVVHPSTKIEFVHTTPCVGDTVLFFDATNYQSQNAMLDGFWLFDSKKYMYNEVFGVKVSDTLPHPVSLHVRTFNGCENIVMDTIFAHDLPRPSVADTVYGCRGTEVLLSDKGMSVDSIREYKWTINGDDSFEKQPAVVFSERGTYPYSLQLTTMYDCSNQTHGVIVMEDFPKADFSFYPEYGAAPLEVEFTNLSENAVDYLWTFEQSVVSEEESPVYIFEDKTRSYAKMRASSKHGCADSVTKYIPVQISDMRLQVTNVDAVLQNGKVQYTVQVLNTGNDNIPEIELALSSSKFPSLIETWYGSLKPNNVLTYTFSVKTSTIDNEIPSYVCATASISAKNQTYYSNQFCKDNTGEFTVYHISPNPVEKHATLAFSTKQKGLVVIECIDNTGKIRMTQIISDVSVGYHTIQFDTSQLSAGLYTIQISQGNQKERKTIMKL